MSVSNLLARETSALLIIDVQEKLMPAITGSERIIGTIRKLANAAKKLGYEPNSNC